jgi:hypothetical protein
MNTPDFESVLLAVWQQTLIDNARNVTVARETFPVRITPKQKLKQIDFRFEWVPAGVGFVGRVTSGKCNPSLKPAAGIR